MAVKVLIPTPLRQFTGRQSSIECSAATVGEALGNLTTSFSELRKHLYTDEGKIRTLLLDAQGARFDPETSQHAHFVCERCGRVVDLFLRQARRVDLSSLAKQGYVVTTHSLTVHGVCQVCAGRRRTSRSQRPAARKP